MKNKLYLKNTLIFVFILLFITAVFLFSYISCFKFSDEAFVKYDTTDVYSKISGKLDKIYIENNAKVKEGEIVAQINAAEYQKILDNAILNLETTKKDLNISKEDIDKLNKILKENKNKIEKAKFNLENANIDYIRYKNAFKDGVVTENDLMKAEKNLDIATRQYKSIQDEFVKSNDALEMSKSKTKIINEEVENLVSQIEKARLNISYTTVIAPKDGIIINNTLDINSKIDTAKPLFSILGSDVYIEAKFKDDIIEKVKENQRVYIKISSKNRIFKGKIAKIVTDENGNKTAKVKFDKNVSKYNFSPDLKAGVSIKIK